MSYLLDTHQELLSKLLDNGGKFRREIRTISRSVGAIHMWVLFAALRAGEISKGADQRSALSPEPQGHCRVKWRAKELADRAGKGQWVQVGGE